MTLHIVQEWHVCCCLVWPTKLTQILMNARNLVSDDCHALHWQSPQSYTCMVLVPNWPCGKGKYKNNLALFVLGYWFPILILSYFVGLCFWINLLNMLTNLRKFVGYVHTFATVSSHSHPNSTIITVPALFCFIAWFWLFDRWRG